MKITIKLFASLRQGRFIEQSHNIPAGISVQQVVTKLDIASDELGMIFINGHTALLNTPLQNGDILSLFPMVGGG